MGQVLVTQQQIPPNECALAVGQGCGQGKGTDVHAFWGWGEVGEARKTASNVPGRAVQGQGFLHG